MATHEEVIERWMIEAGRDSPRFLHKAEHLFVTKEGILYFDASGRGQWNRGRPARNQLLARYIGDRYNGGVCLLNGDGFPNFQATDWQTRIRNRAQRQFGWERCAIVPYEALNGAGINPLTFKSIEITQDTRDSRNIQLDSSLVLDRDFTSPRLLAAHGFIRTDGYAQDPDYYSQTWEGTHRETRQRLQINVQHAARAGVSLGSQTGDTEWRIITAHIWAMPQFGMFGWQTLQRGGSSHIINGRTGGYFHSWVWVEQVHRLGSVVFSAHGPDERRHRWISAFDMQEPGGLYFLAQVPDKGECKTYAHAIDLLSPPIVHTARAGGRRVYRQGDVFAVEISWDDEMVYEGATMRVRRDVVLQDLEGRLARGLTPIEPLEGEVLENGTCPFCTQRHKVGNGPKARRALMIHGTGHTASEVVVKKDGTTYIRGEMHHDPQLETDGRAPDHQPVNMVHTTDGGWFVAVRNTVPRMRAPRVVTEPASATQAGRVHNARVQQEANRARRRVAA